MKIQEQRSEDDERAEIPSNSVDMDGRAKTVPVSVRTFVARLDAVAGLPWQARGNWLRAHFLKYRKPTARSFIIVQQSNSWFCWYLNSRPKCDVPPVGSH